MVQDRFEASSLRLYIFGPKKDQLPAPSYYLPKCIWRPSESRRY